MSQKYEEPPEVFRGHLDECLRHLAAAFEVKYPKNSRGSSEAKKPIADFCGVVIPTVANWFRGEVPAGLAKFKLISYLQLFGYRVMDYGRVKLSRRRFTELIAFKILTPEDAASIVGYSSTSMLFTVLRGDGEASESKDAKMSETWMARRAELEEAKKLAREAFRPDIRLKSMTDGDAIVHAAIKSMECLAALLDAGASQKIVETLSKPDERKAVIQLAEILHQRLSEMAVDLSAVEKIDGGVGDGNGG